jgi:Protein of unknown function (DUF3634)
MALLLTLGLAAFVAWALWFACRPRPAFVVRINGGVPRVTGGTITQAFVQEIAEAFRRHQVENGVVRGVIEGRRIALSFSATVPTACRQQLRNLWTLSGWSTSSRERRR